MSRPQSSRRPTFHFRNPFRMILPKRSDVSSKLLAFEKTIAGRIEKIAPAGKDDDVLQLSWMTRVVQEVIAMHEDLNALIGALELSVSDRKNKWVGSYVENGTKLLDIFNALTSHIHELQEGHHHLHRALSHLGAGTTSETLISACSSLDKWRQQVASGSPSLDRCFPVMDGLSQTLDPPKANASGEVKILMKASYGVRVVTLFTCSAFAASFSRCTKKLKDFQVPDTYSWAKALNALQAGARRMLSTGFREVEAIEAGIEKLNSIVRERVDPAEAKVLVSITSEMRNASGEYSQGLLLLSKETDNFFAVLLSGRKALTDKLMMVTIKELTKA